MATSPQLSFSAQMSNSITYTAGYAKDVQVVIESQNPSPYNVRFDDQWFTSSATFHVFDDEYYEIEVANTYQIVQGIEYIFQNWKKGSSVISTSALTSFNPNEHATYTASYSRKPLPPSNVSAGGQVGNPVHLTWTDNPNSNVTQYEIWRRVKPLGGSQGDPEFVGTVNSGVEQYDDATYVVTESYTHNLLTYDVRSYYSVNGTYSDPNWTATQFGRVDLIANKQDPEMKKSASVPTEYSISSFPNPFNPSTTISYQLAEEANVVLHVFDMMGREVISLVNDRENAGYHSIVWHGKDSRGINVASGTYFYRFTASPLSGKEPYVASGKLLLTK